MICQRCSTILGPNEAHRTVSDCIDAVSRAGRPEQPSRIDAMAPNSPVVKPKRTGRYPTAGKPTRGLLRPPVP